MNAASATSLNAPCVKKCHVRRNTSLGTAEPEEWLEFEICDDRCDVTLLIPGGKLGN